MSEEYKVELKRVVLDEQTFVRLVLKGRRREGTIPWLQVIVRPVLIKNERHLQFSYFTDKQVITKNYRGSEVEEKLNELLALPFNTLHAQSTHEDVVVQITKKGKPIIHRNAPTRYVGGVSRAGAGQTYLSPGQDSRAPTIYGLGNSLDPTVLAHDRSKKLPLPADRPDRFLQAIGIMDAQGKVFPSMQGKFSQVNEFLKLLDHMGELERFGKSPLNILDCGCGSAYLSLATYHYLNDIRGIPARLVGVDINGVLMQKDNEQSEALGFSAACFQKSRIIDYQPEVPPDIVLALHACDTATDEAIAQGIKWRARLILCAPCCHHDLNQQFPTAGLHHLPDVAPFSPVLRHGILKERLADILTDAFRALVLRMMGYKTDVVEFVSSEHTDKNLLIRAIKRSHTDNAAFVQEYLALKNFWGVTPYVEKLLGEQFSSMQDVQGR